jgi:hypothetical protein
MGSGEIYQPSARAAPGNTATPGDAQLTDVTY